MLLCALFLHEPSPVPDRTRQPERLAEIPVKVVCGCQDILSLVLIVSVALFPKALTTLELSTCTTHSLALVRSRQPQLLVCIAPLLEQTRLRSSPRPNACPRHQKSS